MNRPSLDIIAVSHNTRDDLGRCLASVYEHRPLGLSTVFVVDNASTDGSIEHLWSAWPSATVIALDRNVGFGAANNVALNRSVADLVLFLNSDTLVPRGAVDTLVERLEATGATAAGPKLVDARGRAEVSFGRMLTPWTELVQRVRVRASATDGALARRYVSSLLSREREVDWVSGACLLARRTKIVEAGGFDERFFMYEEDVDLCHALRARGGRVLFTPAATITHLRGRSMQAVAPRSTALYDASHVAFYEKHNPRWASALRFWLRLRGRGIR